MSLFALNRFTKKQNKKWGFKLDKTAKEDEEEIAKGEKAAKEKDEPTLHDVFMWLAGDDELISDFELTELLDTVASDPESGLPQEMVMPIVEFVGFFVPEYAQCTMNWEMNLGDFKSMVEMFMSGDFQLNVEEAMLFSFADADNMCTIDEQEAKAALMQGGFSEEEMGMIMDVLGSHAGEDEMLSFDEFKAAYEELTSGPSGPSGPEANGEEVCEGHDFDEATCGEIGCCQWDENQCWSAVGQDVCPMKKNKKKFRSVMIQKKRFSLKKKHMVRKLMKLLRRQVA
jgi:hypothetical protein